jgi:hypothetical protein
MRKYTFIGTEQERLDYSTKEERRPQRGRIYLAEEVVGDTPVSYWISLNSSKHEWQEVFVVEEKVQLTEIEKIMLIDFLNDHFEKFCELINDPTKTFYENFDMLDEGLSGGTEPKVIISNLIDKIEKL